jgi:hypothetical protein
MEPSANRPYIEHAQDGRYKYPNLPGKGSNNAQILLRISAPTARKSRVAEIQSCPKKPKITLKNRLKNTLFAPKNVKNEQKNPRPASRGESKRRC